MSLKRNSYRLIKPAALLDSIVSSYEDIIKAQKQRDFREAGGVDVSGTQSNTNQCLRKL